MTREKITKAKSTKLATLIEEAHKNAAENGYDLMSMTPDEAVDDMMSFDADIETFRRQDVFAAELHYRKTRKVPA